MEFFIVQTFLGDAPQAQNRLLDHMGDPRFRGVYFLLATLLPLNDAKGLHEKLIQYAADTKDRTVSDTFVQLLRPRSLQNVRCLSYPARYSAALKVERWHLCPNSVC